MSDLPCPSPKVSEAPPTVSMPPLCTETGGTSLSLRQVAEEESRAGAVSPAPVPMPSRLIPEKLKVNTGQKSCGDNGQDASEDLDADTDCSALSPSSTVELEDQPSITSAKRGGLLVCGEVVRALRSWEAFYRRFSTPMFVFITLVSVAVTLFCVAEALERRIGALAFQRENDLRVARLDVVLEDVEQGMSLAAYGFEALMRPPGEVSYATADHLLAHMAMPTLPLAVLEERVTTPARYNRNLTENHLSGSEGQQHNGIEWKGPKESEVATEDEEEEPSSPFLVSFVTQRGSPLSPHHLDMAASNSLMRGVYSLYFPEEVVHRHPTASAPLQLTPDSLGFMVDVAVFDWVNDTNGRVIKSGTYPAARILAPLWSYDISAAVSDDRLTQHHDLTWWRVIDAETNQIVCGSEWFRSNDRGPLSGTKDLFVDVSPPSSPEELVTGMIHLPSEVEYRATLRRLGRDFIFEAGGEEELTAAMRTYTPTILLLIGFSITLFCGSFSVVVVLCRSDGRATAGVAPEETEKVSSDMEEEVYEKVLGHINHELRNPLGVIAACLDFIEDEVRGMGHQAFTSATLRSPLSLKARALDLPGLPASPRLQLKQEEKDEKKRDADRAARSGEAETSEASAEGSSQDEYISSQHSRSSSIRSDSTSASSASSHSNGSNSSNGSRSSGCADRISQDLSTMRSAVRQLERQVNDMLDFHLLKTGRLDLAFSSVNLRSVLKEVVREHERLSAVPVRLRCRGALRRCSTDCIVVTDDGRLRQILTNALISTMKMKSGNEISVTYSVQPGCDDANARDWLLSQAKSVKSEEKVSPARLRIDVRDTVAGTRSKDASSMFLAFESYGMRERNQKEAEPTAQQVMMNADLSLPVSYLLVRRLKGVASMKQSSTGTHFSISLPVLRIGNDTPTSTPTPSSFGGLPCGSSGRLLVGGASYERPLRILLVDDMPSNVRLARRLLKSLGHEVTGVSGSNIEATVSRILRVSGDFDVASTASSTSEPCSRGEEEHRVGGEGRVGFDEEVILGRLDQDGGQGSKSFDLIFLDIRLGNEDGVSIYKRLKSSLRSDLPVIALTASVTKRDISSYREAGFDGCVPKPFSRAVFADAIHAVRTKQHIWPSS